MSLQDIERSVLALCLQPQPSEAALEALGDRRVWLLYREMVRDRLRKELRVALPRTWRLLGAEPLERLFSEHLAQDPPRTRFFREVTAAFVQSALPRLRSDATMPPHAADLMAYEAAIWEVLDLDARVREPVQELSFDRPTVVSPAARLLVLRHAVHERASKGGGYRAGEFFVCVHRATDRDKPRAWTLDRPTFAILDALQRRVEPSLTGSLQRVASQQGFVLDAAFVDRFCTQLSSFIEGGLVLGSA